MLGCNVVHHPLTPYPALPHPLSCPPPPLILPSPTPYPPLPHPLSSPPPLLILPSPTPYPALPHPLTSPPPPLILPSPTPYPPLPHPLSSPPLPHPLTPPDLQIWWVNLPHHINFLMCVRVAVFFCFRMMNFLLGNQSVSLE